jgi:hypothetical protein
MQPAAGMAAWPASFPDRRCPARSAATPGGEQPRLNGVTTPVPGPPERGWAGETLAQQHRTHTMECNHELYGLQREGGRPMQRVSITMLLLAWMILAMGGIAWGGAGEQRWTQYWGQIDSITIDRCGQRPGLCEGTMVLMLRHGGKVSLAIRPGMWLNRGDRLVLLEDLRVGDQIHVQAFEVAGAGAEQAAQ